jgi:hypothetical protein
VGDGQLVGRRTVRRPSAGGDGVNGQRQALLVGLAALTSLSLGCGVPGESTPRVLSESELPDGLRPVSTSPDATTREQEVIDVWFVRDGSLARARHSVPSPADASIAVDEVLAGPSASEQGESLRSAIPDPEAVVGVTVGRGVATVDLRAAFAEIPASDQVLAVGQLVLTLTDLRGIGRVEFQVNGEQVPVPLPNGEPSEGTVSRDDYLSLTTP